jgi:hypothetical protein
MGAVGAVRPSSSALPSRAYHGDWKAKLPTPSLTQPKPRPLCGVSEAEQAAPEDGGRPALELVAAHQRGRGSRRSGLRAAAGLKNWTSKHLLWVNTLRFEQPAQEATYLDYLHEVEHAAERLARLERAIDQAIEALPADMKAVIAGSVA